MTADASLPPADARCAGVLRRTDGVFAAMADAAAGDYLPPALTDEAIADLRAARAEVERLRGALRWVMDVGDRAAVDVAHEALGDAAEWHP